ncbi:tobamovirus multiplication protein 1-like isoform X2 [Zingiber officinale]|uniref:tobamovirus multiplication protein 1-like isoform X2 n=1 Tax=Zingiber officinale TaxID=94328 RepID=UPI001C4D4388|nr:tobamovirus multiplication protein 1-like isoform X2 [Zingiber officinale]
MDIAGMSWLPATARSWWVKTDESSQWQDAAFYSLCAAYSCLSAFALIQVARIQLRVPEYGWTAQKVFLFMNFLVNGVRALVFGFHNNVLLFRPSVFALVLLDLPGILFFSTYTLLVLSWAEIYHQAKDLPSDKLRITYIIANCVIYFIQVFIWMYLWINDNRIVELVGNIFVAVISFVAALGFLVYGGSLFCLLRCFPAESKGRQKKLLEVGSVTAICFTCFLIRCLAVSVDDPVLSLVYHQPLALVPH